MEIVSVTEQFDTSTAIGRAFLAILMVVASLESDLASERTSSTIDYLKSQGVHWGQTPYGYTRDENSIPQPDDNNEVVVEALEFYAEGGLSYQKVARHLNKLGYRWRNRQGEPAPFNKYAVRSIVSNVLIYAGWVPQGRGKDMRITDDAHTLRELVLITDAVAGQHPPIIEEELVDEVLAARHKRLDLGSSPYRVYIPAHSDPPLRGLRPAIAWQSRPQCQHRSSVYALQRWLPEWQRRRTRSRSPGGRDVGTPGSALHGRGTGGSPPRSSWSVYNPVPRM